MRPGGIVPLVSWICLLNHSSDLFWTESSLGGRRNHSACSGPLTYGGTCPTMYHWCVVPDWVASSASFCAISCILVGVNCSSVCVIFIQLCCTPTLQRLPLYPRSWSLPSCSGWCLIIPRYLEGLWHIIHWKTPSILSAGGV